MTNYFKKVAFVAVVSIAGAGFVGADGWDKKTTITTDQVLQLPNATLQPGTYVMRLVETDPTRHIVQFFDKDQKHLVTTILAIPNQRLRPTEKTMFAFWEMPAGQPTALRAWFYPGDEFGQEFAYPKAAAAEITANNKGATVPISDEQPGDLAATAAAEPAPAAEPARAPEPPVEVAAVPQQNTTPAPVETPAPRVDADRDRDDAQRIVAQNTPPAAPSTTPETLPRTASDLPLVGLIGFLSIVGALVLNLSYRRGLDRPRNLS